MTALRMTFISFLSLFVTSSLMASSPSSDQKPAEKKPTVIVQDVKTQKMSDRLVYPGRVRSKIEALVTAENEGQLKEILKPVGSFVRRGEAVLIIQNTDPVYKFAPVKVHAPASGLLSRLDVSLLSKVEKGAPLFLITDPGALKIEVEIPANELGYFKIGHTGKVESVTGDGSKVETDAKVVGLSPLVDPKTGTATAQLEFGPKALGQSSAGLSVAGQSLRPGLIVQVQFNVNGRESVILPSSSLTYKEGKPHVRILDGVKAQRVPVEIRSELGGSVELKSGVTGGAKVITRSNRFISDGEEVEIETSKTE